MATSSIHLELVCDLTAEAFLAAFARLVSQRGMCRSVYSVNDTAFIGADNELREITSYSVHLPITRE
jgi:hypothetical protein